MRHRTRRLAVPLAVSVALVCAACGSDDPTVETSSTGNGTEATSSASPVPTSLPTATEDGDGDGAEPAFSQPGTTARQAGEGNGLSVVDVRAGTHDGYDRVVFELGGEGTVGWRVAYDDAPATQGEGAEVELPGDATISVLLENVGYPFDTGVEEYSGDKDPTFSHPQVKALQVGGVFEGYYDAFIGVAQEQPFRVFRLDDPQRVVVDVQH